MPTKGYKEDKVTLLAVYFIKGDMDTLAENQSTSATVRI